MEDLEEKRKKHAEKTRQWRLKNPEKHKEQQRKYYEKNKLKRIEYSREYQKKYRQTEEGKQVYRDAQKRYQEKHGFHARYVTYRSKAKRKNREFGLTEEEAIELMEGRCRYCLRCPGGGIDRVDNTKGYVKGNVVSCCAIHNRMKRDMTHEEFVRACIEVVENEKNK